MEKWYTYEETLWYTDATGKDESLEPGTKFKLFCQYKGGKSCLRWGSRIFLVYTKLVHEVK